MILAIVLTWLLSLSITASVGQSHAALQSSPAIANPAAHRGVNLTRLVPHRGKTIVILPYGGGYYLPPTVVVASPYFCVFHHEAFVSRIGMIDHLSSMHGVPLTTAASIYPDANGNCIFPAY